MVKFRLYYKESIFDEYIFFELYRVYHIHVKGDLFLSANDIDRLPEYYRKMFIYLNGKKVNISNVISPMPALESTFDIDIVRNYRETKIEEILQ